MALAIQSLSGSVLELFSCPLGLGVSLFEMNVAKMILAFLLTLKFREAGEFSVCHPGAAWLPRV